MKSKGKITTLFSASGRNYFSAKQPHVLLCLADDRSKHARHDESGLPRTLPFDLHMSRKLLMDPINRILGAASEPTKRRGMIKASRRPSRWDRHGAGRPSSESHLPERSWSAYPRDVCAAAALIIRLLLRGSLTSPNRVEAFCLPQLVSSQDNISLSLWISASSRLLGRRNAEIIARCSR